VKGGNSLGMVRGEGGVQKRSRKRPRGGRDDRSDSKMRHATDWISRRDFPGSVAREEFDADKDSPRTSHRDADTELDFMQRPVSSTPNVLGQSKSNHRGG